MKYEVVYTPREWAEAYIAFFASAAAAALRISPPARVRATGSGFLLKFTGIGKKMRHHVYVEFREERGRGVFTVKPPYPMYLLAAVAPFFALPSFPMYAAREGDSVKVVLTQSYEEAVTQLADALTKMPLLDPADFLLEGASFEGFLYRLPAGYVAFIEEKPGFGSYLDEIETHEEEEEEGDDIMYIDDFFAKIVEEILKNA